MGKIDDDVIEQLKSQISLLRLVESQGYELKREGKDYVMHCSFHDDKTPSLKISPSNNLFHCFGCGAGGSVIDWVMKTQGASFKHAVEILKNNHALVATDKKIVKRSSTQKLPSPLTEDSDIQTALQQVVAFYHDTLKQNPDVLAYLKQRGLDDESLINHFKLGYANRTLGLHLPQKNRMVGAKLRSLLQSMGVIRKSGHEHFAGSLVVPVQNGEANITEVYGRKILGKRLRKGTPQHLYLPGPHQGVFNLGGLTGEEIILCESLIDALTFWRHGFKQVTASYGTSGFTDELLQTFIKRKIKRVLVAYDNDNPGNNAAKKLAKRLQQNNMDVFRIHFPVDTDANAYVCQINNDNKQEALANLIRHAEPMGQIKHDNPHTLAATLSEKALHQNATSAPQTQSVEHNKNMQADVKNNEVHITLSNRVYRVKGLPEVMSESLKINLMVSMDDSFHMDKLDLYSSKQRQVFINQASMECKLKSDVIKKDLGQILLKLESLQQQKDDGNETEKNIKILSDDDKEAALVLLNNKNLTKQILNDFKVMGVVGEDSNKLAGYLACTSRKLNKPLAVMIQSSSAAGKSSLMDAILNLMPEHEKVQYSAMTGQSLFYMGETNLKNKILGISEEEGAHNASYALKLLQSEGEVTIASTGKDENSGDLVTKDYRVEGPVMLLMTTTAIDIDEELLNRCLVLSVNESREQTRAIHEAQRKSRTLDGLKNKIEKNKLTTLHRNAQSLLKPLHVINPYAEQLTFLSDKTRTRRDHEKYLTLIDSIALLHQYQRDIKSIEHGDEIIEYIEVTLDDVKLANALAHNILGRTLDELPPQTRKLLTLIQTMVQRDAIRQGTEQNHIRFSRKQVRDLCGWSETQVRVHMQRLTEMEYLLTHRGGRGQSFEYELLYQGEAEQQDVFMMGLIDVNDLQKTSTKINGANTTMTTSWEEGLTFVGSTRGHRGEVADNEKSPQPLAANGFDTSSRIDEKKVNLAV